MGQSTWANSTDTWTSTIYIWANQTYQDSISVGNTLSATTTNSIAMPVDATISQLFLTELHEEDRDSPVAAILSNSMGVSADCVLVLPVNADLDNTLDTTSTNNTVFPLSATLNSTLDTSSESSVKFVSAAVLNQSLSSTNAEDATLISNAILTGNYGIIVSGNIVMPGSATLDLTTGHTHRTNYPHSISTRSIHSMSASSKFLWTDIDEETGTWTDVTEASSSWVDVTEDTSSWTKQ